MTVLQDRLAEVGAEARWADPARLAAQAMQGATRHRRQTKAVAGVGTAVAIGLVVAVSQRAGTDVVVVPGRPASGGGTAPTFYSPAPHNLLRLLLAAGFSVPARQLVGWRDRSAGVRVARLERALAGLWGASLALWALSAVQLMHAAIIGLRFFGHPYVTLLSAGLVPLLAVGLLVNGSSSARRLTILALSAHSAVVLSLFYAGPGIQGLGGTSALGTALALMQAVVVLTAVGVLTWPSRPPGAGSPSWQLAAVWSAAGLILVNVFFHDPVAGPDPGVITNDGGYFGLGSGPLAHGIAWGAGILASLLVGLALWRGRERWAGPVVVAGLMIALLAGLSLNLYSNTYPSIDYGWGPYLGWWWLAGWPVLAWLVVRHRVAGRRVSPQE